ncbi:MAG: PAS domain S-box protein, partial [Bacteroidia bacterium]
MENKDKTKDELLQELLNLKQEIEEKKHYESAFKQSKNKYQEVIENIKEVVFQTDVNGLWLFLNKSWEEVTGFSIDESVGQLFVNYVHADDRQRNLDLFAPLINREKDYCRHQVRYLTKDGGFRWVEVFARLSLNSNNEIIGTYGTLLDITDQKKMVSDLAFERKSLEDIIKGTNVGPWRWNIQTGETDFSERWFGIMGYTKAELAPISIATWAQQVHPDDLLLSGELLDKHFKGELEYYSCEVRMKHKNGDWVWVLSNGKVHTWDDNGKPLWMSGFHLEITENKRILADLKESQEKHRALNEASFDSIFFTENGICIEQNETAKQVFGYTNEEAIGKPATDFFILADRALVKKNIQNNSQEPYEVTALKKDGTTFPVLLNIKLMHFKGRIVRVTSFRDITLQKQTEKALLESQVLFSKFMKFLPAMVFIKDNESNVIYRNNSMIKALGDKATDQKSLFELYGKEIAERIIAEDKKTFENNYTFIEESFMHLDDTLHDHEIHKFTIQIPEQKNLIGAIVLDITERKKTEKALLESQVLFSKFMEFLPAMIFIKDSESNIIYRNNSMIKALGNEATDQKSLFDIYGKETAERILADDKKTFEKNYVAIEESFMHADGTLHEYETQKFTIPIPGQKTLLGAIALDVTERKKTEEALLKSQVQFTKFMDYSPSLVFIKDHESKMIYSNKAMDKALGTSTWVNKSLYELFDKETVEIILAHDKETLENNYTIIEESFKNLDGKIHNYETQKFTIPILGQKPLLGGIALDITLRKQAEEKFSKAFQSNSVQMILSSLTTGIILDANEKALETLGLTKEEVIGKTSVDLGLFGNMAERTKAFDEILALKENETSQREVSFETKAKGLITCFLAVKKITIGKELCVLVSMIDITERKKTEASLYESEEKLRTIIETSPDGIIISSLDGTIQFVTKKTYTIFNYEFTAKVIGKSVFEFIDPDYLSAAKDNFGNWLRGKIILNAYYSMLKSDGSSFFGEANSNILKDKSGIPIGILIVIRDISERIQAEKELADGALRMKLATQSGGVGIWNYEFDNDILNWDEQMYKIYGIENKDQKIDNNLWNGFIHPDDLELTVRKWDLAFNEHQDYNIIYRIIRPDGKTRYLNAQAIIQYNEENKPIHLLGTNRDITEKILAEAETNKARKEAEDANLAKSEFLSRMSHELRTPLNSILGFAQLMQMGELNTKQKNGVEHILSSGKHLLGLISEVLELSKIEAGHISNKHENVNIEEKIFIVIDALNPALLEKKIKVEFSPTIDHVPTIKSDNKLITQVLFNLLSNAIKYNNTNGIIKINTEIIGDNANEAEKIKVSITDTGNGIAAENLQKLFNPFERINAADSGIEGTGLGLSVVKKLMEVLEGNVGVESEVSVGSTFWITFPLKSNNELQKEKIGNQNVQILELQSEVSVFEKDKISRADELEIANIELDYQQQEKIDRASELKIANIELEYQKNEKAD